MNTKHTSYWQSIWHRFRSRPSGMLGLCILLLFVCVALFAPFLASSIPLCVVYDNTLYFPLFRYLFSESFFTKKIDIFYNLLGIVTIAFLCSFFFQKNVRRYVQLVLIALQLVGFWFFGFFYAVDPANSPRLNIEKQKAFLELKGVKTSPIVKRQKITIPSWEFDLAYMTPYAKLLLLLKEKTSLAHHKRVLGLLEKSGFSPRDAYTPYKIEKEQELKTIKRFQKELDRDKSRYNKNIKEEKELRKKLKNGQVPTKTVIEKLVLLEEENTHYEELQNRLQYILDRHVWVEKNVKKITFLMMPLVRDFHWEDDAGGEQALNVQLPFYEQTRITHKDLMAALIFGSRISLMVGFLATVLSLVIGISLGLICGFYGARLDLIFCRFVEVWESMPAFFMLLFIITIMQTKSIFVIIAVIAIFGWTQGFRFVRAETFRQRSLSYVFATKALGFSDMRILFSHILPNAILAVLALLPFDIMRAITQEAGLAFLGLGEEQSCSWGVLMDEGRFAFPAESALLWPPATVLTILLISIAFVGASFQWAMNPKAQSE